MLGFPVLRIYLLAEHERCLKVEDMFLNTRTTPTIRVVRFLACKLPYHAEHHAMPQIPFYKLPTFHEITAVYLGQLSDGYSRYSTEYVSTFGD